MKISFNFKDISFNSAYILYCNFWIKNLAICLLQMKHICIFY